MGHVRQLEPTVDERIKVTIQVLWSRYAATRIPLDLAVYIRSVNIIHGEGFSLSLTTSHSLH